MRKLVLAVPLIALLAGCGKSDKPDAPQPAASKKDDKKDDDDGPGVTMKKDAWSRAGIKVAALASRTIQPEVVAYGRVEEDPSASFIARAPVAGTLHVASGQTWPALGQSLVAGTAFGRIEPKLAVSDRISLNTQLASARADLNSGLAAVTAAQTVYDRAKALNADNKNVSDRAVSDAAARLAAEKAREAGALSMIQALETLLASTGTADARPLAVERGGDVVEVLAQPGESVEQGAPIVRIAQFDRLLVRVDLPVGERLPASGVARVVPAGFEDQPPIAAERVAVAAASDPRGQGIGLIYRLARTPAELRPGAAVTAHFTLPGKSSEALVIPRSAIVQQDGRQWVYVQTTDDRFARRPVPLDQPTADGFIADRGFSEGDRLVVVGAQTLLSEEFKSANEADTN